MLHLNRLPHAWPVYGGPAQSREVLGRDVISKSSETALTTQEPGLTRTIGRLCVPIRGTASARIPGIYEEDGHSSHLGLVDQEGLKTAERPGVEGGPLAAMSPDPRTDVLQIFEHDPSLCAFAVDRDPLADRVIDPGAEPPLLSAAAFQKAPCALCPLLLKALPEATVAATQSIYLGSSVLSTVTRNGDLGNAEIDSEPIDRASLRKLGVIDGGVQIPFAIPEHEVALSLSSGEQLTLTSSTDEWNCLTAIECPDGDRFGLIPQNSIIVGYGAKPFESTLDSSAGLVAVGHLRDQPHNHLRAETSRCSCLSIDQPMQTELLERLMGPRLSTDPARRGIALFQGAEQCLSLARVRQEFDLRDQLHEPDCIRLASVQKKGAQERLKGAIGSGSNSQSPDPLRACQ